MVYQQQLALQHTPVTQQPPDFQQALDSQELFPNVVLLMINEEPWEEYPQLWEVNKPLNTKWITNLIEE